MWFYSGGNSPDGEPTLERSSLRRCMLFYDKRGIFFPIWPVLAEQRLAVTTIQQYGKEKADRSYRAFRYYYLCTEKYKFSCNTYFSFIYLKVDNSILEGNISN